MIYKQIEEEIVDYLKLLKDDFVSQYFDFEVISGWYNNDIYEVEVHGFYKDNYEPEKQTPFILLRFYEHFQDRQIQISNIFLPDFMRYKGIGKNLIYKVFTISEKKLYELFIVEMVNSFYERMIKRGAIACVDCGDAVQIVGKTNLF